MPNETEHQDEQNSKTDDDGVDLDELLSDDETDEEDEEGSSSDDDQGQKDDKGTGKEGKPAFSKKIGSQVFTSEEDYDKHVQKLYGDNTRLAGEQNKETKTKTKDDVKTAPQESPDANSLRWKMKVEDFMEEVPDAENYREEMALFIKKGKANINGRPNLPLAYARSLKADGKKIPDWLVSALDKKGSSERKGEDNKQVKTKLFRAGGGAGSAGADVNYSQEGEIEETSSFADAAILGL